MHDKPKIVVIVGPTASGKSDFAVRIAKQFNGEVISADSRQVYKKLNIGTGKITRKEMGGIPHHLLDMVPPTKQYSVVEYQQDAKKAIAGILQRGKLPIICGGTGFYIDAFVYNSLLPDVPPNEKLRNMLSKKTTFDLYEILRRKDPNRADTIDPHNPRRLVRAIEIATAIGSVPKRTHDSAFTALFIGMHLPAETLRERIHARLRKRISKGMITEVRNLHVSGLPWKRMEEIGLEYRYISRYLRGTITKKEMFTALESEITKYAKRQYTWFRGNKNIHWIPIDDKKLGLLLLKKFIKNTPAH